MSAIEPGRPDAGDRRRRYDAPHGAVTRWFGPLVDPETATYRWWVLGVTSIGALLASSMDPSVMFRTFSGSQTGATGIDLGPFIDALHVAFAVGAVVSLIGAGVSMLRGEHRSWEAAPAGTETIRSTSRALEG